MSIVKDGLVGYWHYKQGFKNGSWENISPNTKGRFNGVVTGAVMQSDGVYFDGIDDSVKIPSIRDTSFGVTFEVVFKVPSVNQGASIIFSDSDLGILIYNIPPTLNGYLIGIDSNDMPYTVGSLPPSNVLMTATITIDLNTKTVFYINGVKIGNSNYTPYSNIVLDVYIMGVYNYGIFQKGTIKSAKLYNKALTQQEVLQNYAVGHDNIGLDEGQPVAIPKATIISQSRNKISKIETVDRSIVRFKFDQDVTEWKVRTGGSNPDTGILADNGNEVKAGVEITAEVDWTELQQEGQNKINIYGKNTAGWTSYTE